MNQVPEFEIKKEELLNCLEDYITAVRSADVKEVADLVFFKQLRNMSEKVHAADVTFIKIAGKITGTSEEQLSSGIPYHLCFIPS